MTLLDLVRSRRSVRTFDGKGLAEDEKKELLDFAASADNPYGLPLEWRLLETETTGLSSPVIVGEKAYLAAKIRRVPHAEEALGFSFERVVLHAAEKGIGTTWIAGTMDRAAFERAAGVAEGEVMPCVTPLGYPAKKMSFRETVMRKGVRADSRLLFETLFFEGSFDRPLLPDNAGKLYDALEAVRLAPSAVNKQPWRAVVCGDRVHFYEKCSKPLAEGAWDIQKIDMGIALCHFALAAQESGIPVSFLREDPGLAHGTDTFYIASYQLEG